MFSHDAAQIIFSEIDAFTNVFLLYYYFYYLAYDLLTN